MSVSVISDKLTTDQYKELITKMPHYHVKHGKLFLVYDIVPLSKGDVSIALLPLSEKLSYEKIEKRWAERSVVVAFERTSSKGEKAIEFQVNGDKFFTKEWIECGKKTRSFVSALPMIVAPRLQPPNDKCCVNGICFMDMISNKDYEELHREWQALEEAQRKQQPEPKPVKSGSPAAAKQPKKKPENKKIIDGQPGAEKEPALDDGKNKKKKKDSCVIS